MACSRRLRCPFAARRWLHWLTVLTWAVWTPEAANYVTLPGGWHVDAWGPCEASSAATATHGPVMPTGCSAGTQRRTVICGLNASWVSCNGLLPASTRTCGMGDLCGYHISPWGPCDSSCGQQGKQTRSAQCIAPTLPGACKPIPLERTCSVYSSQCGSWYTSVWSACSESCGPGTQDRFVACLSNAGCSGQRPTTIQSCQGTTCQWSLGAWSTCSSGCEQPGTQQRTKTCAIPGACSGSPNVSRSCVGAPCPTSSTMKRTTFLSSVMSTTPPTITPATAPPPASTLSVPAQFNWFIGVWSRCDGPCGSRQYRRREVVCHRTCAASRCPIVSNGSCTALFGAAPPDVEECHMMSPPCVASTSATTSSTPSALTSTTTKTIATTVRKTVTSINQTVGDIKGVAQMPREEGSSVMLMIIILVMAVVATVIFFVVAYVCWHISSHKKDMTTKNSNVVDPELPTKTRSLPEEEVQPQGEWKKYAEPMKTPVTATTKSAWSDASRPNAGDAPTKHGSSWREGTANAEEISTDDSEHGNVVTGATTRKSLKGEMFETRKSSKGEMFETRKSSKGEMFETQAAQKPDRRPSKEDPAIKRSQTAPAHERDACPSMANPTSFHRRSVKEVPASSHRLREEAAKRAFEQAPLQASQKERPQGASRTSRRKSAAIPPNRDVDSVNGESSETGSSNKRSGGKPDGQRQKPRRYSSVPLLSRRGATEVPSNSRTDPKAARGARAAVDTNPVAENGIAGNASDAAQAATKLEHLKQLDAELDATLENDIEWRKRHFKGLLLKWHPDKNTNGMGQAETSAQANDIFKHLLARRARYLRN